jgi:hypothetical protein
MQPEPEMEEVNDERQGHGKTRCKKLPPTCAMQNETKDNIGKE